jgi:flagellar protein FlaJ
MDIEQGFDKDEVDRIVDTMKKKYQSDGAQFEEVGGALKELRGIIAEDTYAKADITNKEDLDSFDSKLAKQVGEIYLKLKKYLAPIKDSLKKFPLSTDIGYYLYSANMSYSASQFLALASAAGLIGVLFGFIAGLFLAIILASTNPVLAAITPIISAIALGAIITIIVIDYPRQAAISRGNACSIELPFALRHIATELKAGIGLYKTIQAVTATDYGVLSEEFARTINEIEEGTDTSVALKHMALRTQSRPLKSALNHMLRAMRVGGNLSHIMSEIAEEVSDDLKTRISTFSQQMNFFAVIFIFVGIVLPVAVMILGAIRNSPMGSTGNLFKSVPLTPELMIIFYVIVMPVLFAALNYFVYLQQPKM